MKSFITLFSHRITSLLSLLLLFAVNSRLQAQCANAPTLKFHSPVLLSGTDGQVGAVYNFANVAPGLDAHIKITFMSASALLYNIDDSAGIGYYDAFQPYVGAGANDTSYIDWRIVFKKAGTNTDTTLPCLAVTAVDVDGDGQTLKEFIEAATPGSFSVDPYTNLGVSFDGIRSKAISPVANIPLIDTNRLEAMFQMNFTNINSLDYRNGAISTYGASQIRQTCIYFKPFFASYFLLPLKLLSFSARAAGDAVELKWTASDEQSLKYYTLQRSENGKSWISIGKIPVQSKTTNEYLVNDFTERTTTTYYRLMEVGTTGSISYSSIVKISPVALAKTLFSHNTVFSNSIRLQSTVSEDEECMVALYAMTGAVALKEKVMLRAGSNTSLLDVKHGAAAGVYLLVIKNRKGAELYHGKLVKTGN